MTYFEDKKFKESVLGKDKSGADTQPKNDIEAILERKQKAAIALLRHKSMDLSKSLLRRSWQNHG